MNIVQCIRAANREAGDHPAVIEADRTCSYEELLEQTGNLCRELQKAGIGSGQRIGFRCEDGIEYIIGALALLESGAAMVPIASSLPAAEEEDLIERMDVDGILTYASLKQNIPNTGLSETEEFLLANNASFYFRYCIPAAAPPEELKKIKPAFIRFSSGTTGTSKGVVLSHDTVYERTEAADRGLRITRNDRILWVLSMSHHFVVSILLFLRKGATIIVAHRNFPFSIVNTVRQIGVTFIYASPFHYHLLASASAIPAESLENTRLAVSTAMKLPGHSAAAFYRKFGFLPAEAYGIIEVGLPFINLDPDANSKPSGSVGKILPDYQVFIKNADAAGYGEVLIRGPGMFDAYYSPWQWREECLENGWFNSGDIGRLNSSGELELAGRTKTVIISAGMKIFPDQVENVINRHPKVKESMVYGINNEAAGQVPAAEIVPSNPGAEPASLWPELRRYCYSHLSAYKVPKHFLLVESLPKTASGKLRRRDQRQLS